MRSTSLPRPFGRCLVAFLLVGCASGPRPAATPDATPTRATPSGGSIKGSVRDAASAQPISFVEVVAVDLTGRRITDTTRSDGSFQLADLPPGAYWVTATYSGHSVRYDNVRVAAQAVVSLEFEIDADADNVTIDYAASRREPSTADARPPAIHHTGSIRGVVRDGATHEQLPGAVVAATTPKLRNARMAIADDDGSYLLPSLPPGIYTLSVYYHLIERGNIELRQTNISVAPGEIKVVNLDLDAETDQ